MSTLQLNKISFTQVNNDTDGNPRFVTHFLNLIHESDNYGVNGNYELALKRAKKIGGRKFHNKQFGGGIVFSCGSTEVLERRIKNLMDSIN
jgi:hypothetical protein